MRLSFPPTHVQAHFAEQCLSYHHAYAVNAGEVHARSPYGVTVISAVERQGAGLCASCCTVPGRGMMHRQGATPMVTRVIEFSPTSDAAAEFVQVIEETALRIVKAQAECIVAFVRVRGQVVMSVSVWKSLSDAERYSRECYPDIEKMLRPFLKCDPKLYTFESRQIEFLNMRARAMVPKTSTRTRKLSSPNESTRTRLDQQSA